MTKPSDFILNTDYATLKNDAATSATVTVLGSQAIPATIGAVASYIEFHTDVTIGVKGSITRLQVSSSKDASTIYSTRTISYQRTGSTPSGPGISNYSLIAFVYRINSTTLRCQVFIPNPYAEVLTTEAGNETITFYVNTFIPPYA